MRKIVRAVFILITVAGSVKSVDFSNVPGTVLDYQPLSYALFQSAPRIFISDPEILVLSNGNYLAAHALAGSESGSGSSGKTSVFVSTDKGESWTQLGGTLNGILRASLFELNGAVYLLGANKDTSGNSTVVAKSTDGGTNWNTSIFSFNGPGTPNNPVVFNNKIWSAGSLASYSASVDADLTLSSSWTRKLGFPSSSDHPEWPSEGETISEGQILASSETGLVILPKVSQHALSALARVNANTGAVSFDPDNDFVSLPGGEKKFGAAYDSVSGKFYILSNPILQGDYASGVADMIRNTAAILTSSDLRNWKVEKIFLHSNDAVKDGFGYFNFDFDGDDMALVARTAFPVGSDDPRRGHDSNLLTFHKLEGFRNLKPEHYLKISGNQVLRYERTVYQDALIGRFTQGTVFNGSALGNPDDLAQDSNGDVYIHETAGRILRFDATGNFLEITNASPVAFQGNSLNVEQPSDGSATWICPGSGNWFAATNWYYWGRADTPEEIAVFGSAISSNAVITVSAPYTLRGLRFLTDHSCLVSGSGALTFSTDAVIDVQKGIHSVSVPLNLNDDLSVSTGAESSLTTGPINNPAGKSLYKTGNGTLTVGEGSFSLNGGTLTVGGGSILFTNSSCNFNGTVRFMAAPDFVATAGHSCRIITGKIYEGMFDQILLPELEEGLAWDVSELYSGGTVTVVARVPAEWMSRYGLAEDGSEDFIDSDGDGMSNYAEWKAGTNPTNSQSLFALSQSPVASNGFRLSWNSITGRTYRIEVSTNLMDTPAFQTLQSGIQGEFSSTEFIDTNKAASTFFYRAVVE